MNFASDNSVGASRPVLDAIVAANDGALASYGADPHTRRAAELLADIFERPVDVFLVATGTAANALALAALTPPFGHVVCHARAHVIDDECGAPEFFTHGAKLVGLSGPGGKIAPETLDTYLSGLSRADRQMPARALSLSQATEMGLVYTPDEVAALGSVARRHGLRVHMDGARFANAVVASGCRPADLTWRAGVDILCFGATKNGCLAAEAVVIFDPDLAASMPYLRKRAGQTLSKGRLLGAQMEAYLAQDHWLDNARHANAMAARLATALAETGKARLAVPVEANEIFLVLPVGIDAALREAGAVYHPWPAHDVPEGSGPGSGEMLVRLVTSFATSEADVERFVTITRERA